MQVGQASVTGECVLRGRQNALLSIDVGSIDAEQRVFPGRTLYGSVRGERM